MRAGEQGAAFFMQSVNMQELTILHYITHIYIYTYHTNRIVRHKATMQKTHNIQRVL